MNQALITTTKDLFFSITISFGLLGCRKYKNFFLIVIIFFAGLCKIELSLLLYILQPLSFAYEAVIHVYVGQPPWVGKTSL